jgi:L-amino acid N-acyltransferase YncA
MEVKYIDALPVERWEEYKNLKIDALRNEEQAFSFELEDALKYDDKYWKDDLQKALEGKKILVFAEYEGVLIGLAGAYLFEKKEFNHNVNLNALYVKAEYRGKGIGKGLVNKRIEISKDRHPEVTQIFTEIFASQVASIKLHLALGFEEVGRIKKFVHNEGEYFDSIFFQKEIE